VALAELFARLLQPDELRILPAGQPWQKTNGLQASDVERVAMLELAFEHAPFPATLDLREIDRNTPTYTVETLRELRAELGPDASIVFLMGADQLQKLDSWRDWQDLFALANFGVAARPGYRLDAAGLPPAVARELAQRHATPAEVRACPAGKVCLAHTLAVDISATQVRATVHAGKGKDISALITPQVLDYIQQHNLYKS
jgi:nicotinate-nucleotide adenylyltransferase